MNLLLSWFLFSGNSTRKKGQKMAFRSRIEIIHMNKQYGLIISVFIHVIILAIPVSMVVKDKIREVELFVVIEETRNRPARVITQRETLKQFKPVQEKKLHPEEIKKIVKPVEESITKEYKQEVIESIIVDRNTIEEQLQQNKIDLPTEIKVQSSTGANIIKEIDKPIETDFGSSVAPAFLHRVMPEYPMLAKKLGKEGKVVLRLTIDNSGNLVDIEVIKKADYGFTEAAIEAVKKSTFLPAKKDGKPVASKAILPISFILRR